MTERLIIKKTEETPAIILNPSKGVFQIVGRSWSENAITFYEPIFAWFKKYFDNSPLDITNIEFRFEYLNTSTSKQIAVLISEFKKKSQKHKINIRWFYEEDDDDMKKEGKRYSSLLQMNFEFIETKSR